MKIEPLLGGNSSDPAYLQYVYLIQEVLEAFVPAFFEEKNIKARLKRDLPFVMLREGRGCEKNVSFFLLSKSRPDAFKFFFEMICRWLLPGESLNVVMIHAVDFALPEVDNTVYNLSEIVVRVEGESLREKIAQALPLLEGEIKKGIASKKEAAKILEAKGYKQDEKIAVLQERLGQRIDRFPSLYQADLFREMQNVLLLAPEGFKQERKVDHLLRVILFKYHTRKELLEHIHTTPHKRRVFLKLIRFPFEGAERVGVNVGMNFLEEKEIFGEKQLIKALNHHFPFIRPSEGSSLYSRRARELVTTVYTEIEHIDGRSFSEEELQELTEELPKDLLAHVEYIMHPLFMPRNEEEIMRNMMTLAQEITSLEEKPQGVIMFDQQTRTHIFFTVILVRLVDDLTPSLKSLFEKEPKTIQYLPDRIKVMGTIGRRYLKEATVFQLRLSKEQFLRLDHSIDVRKARQFIVNEITSRMGAFRDYNGGMIAKKEELLDSVRALLSRSKYKYNAVWLENFFYSLTPTVMQTLLDPFSFVKAFRILSEGLKASLPLEEAYKYRIEKDFDAVYVFCFAHERRFIEEFEAVLKSHQSRARELVVGELVQGDMIASAVIYRSKDSEKLEAFADKFIGNNLLATRG